MAASPVPHRYAQVRSVGFYGIRHVFFFVIRLYCYRRLLLLLLLVLCYLYRACVLLIVIRFTIILLLLYYYYIRMIHTGPMPLCVRLYTYMILLYYVYIIVTVYLANARAPVMPIQRTIILYLPAHTVGGVYSITQYNTQYTSVRYYIIINPVDRARPRRHRRRRRVHRSRRPGV